MIAPRSDASSEAFTMDDSATAQAVLALHRFGMGPRPGSVTAIAADPRGALLAELERSPAVLDTSTLVSRASPSTAVSDANARRQAMATVAKREEDKKKQQMAETSPMMSDTSDMAAK